MCKDQEELEGMKAEDDENGGSEDDEPGEDAAMKPFNVKYKLATE